MVGYWELKLTEQAATESLNRSAAVQSGHYRNNGNAWAAAASYKLWKAGLVLCTAMFKLKHKQILVKWVFYIMHSS